MFISLEDPRGRENLKGLLMKGGVICVPTDTVWGLACLSDQPQAVQRIFEIKERPRTATLPLFVPEPESLWDYSANAGLPRDKVSRILERFTPGPLTIAIPVRPDALGPHLIHPNGTTAFRIPDFPALRELLRILPAPLAATSLNLHGRQPVRGLRLVSRLYEPLVDAVAVHPLAPLNHRVSTVMGFVEGEPTVFREGTVTAARLAAALS